MKEVQNILNNPLLKQSLRLVAPEVFLGLELLTAIGSNLFTRTPSVEELVAVIDKRLAVILQDLATTKSQSRRRQCEVRAHELLGILNEWEKIT